MVEYSIRRKPVAGCYSDSCHSLDDLESGDVSCRGRSMPGSLYEAHDLIDNTIPHSESSSQSPTRRPLVQRGCPTRTSKEHKHGWIRLRWDQIRWGRHQWGISFPEFVRYIVPSNSWATGFESEKIEPVECTNMLGQNFLRKQQAATYLSKTTLESRRLMVQCTRPILDDKTRCVGDWYRVNVSGSIPLALKMALWALKPLEWKDKKQFNQNAYIKALLAALGVLATIVSTLLVGPLLQILMSFPGMEAPWEYDAYQDTETYDDFPDYHWNWPKSAIVTPDEGVSLPGNKSSEVATEFSSKQRAMKPKKLMIFNRAKGQYELDSSGRDVPFVLISFTRAHFHVEVSKEYNVNEQKACKAQQQLEDLAHYVTQAYFESAEAQGLRNQHEEPEFAYWLDYQCGAKPADKDFAQYVNTICDVVRLSRKVIVALPFAPVATITTGFDYKKWGASVWTLCEVLLARGDVQMCWPNTRQETNRGKQKLEPSYHVETKTKLEMTNMFWDTSDTDLQTIRILAEQFSGTLSLSRIELFIVGLTALQDLFCIGYYHYDEISRALMALFHHRIDAAGEDEEKSMFRSLSRLVMANDSDKLIERMISWAPVTLKYPLSSKKYEQVLTDVYSTYNLARPDQFGCRLWDIQPKCKLVGVSHQENMIVVDDCRSMSIRWKNFPKLKYKRNYGFKKKMAELFVRSGAVCFGLSIYLLYNVMPLIINFGMSGTTPVPLDDQGDSSATTTLESSERLFFLTILFPGFLFVVAFILSLLSPICVRRLYGGSVVEASPHLVAFEETLQEDTIEILIFGNDRKRLGWQPAATPLSYAHKELREGIRPPWFTEEGDVDDSKLNAERREKGIPEDHSIFTLVDTGLLKITTFSARNPPTAALLCGRDGGMLRAVLCSWDFEDRCSYKEAVVRMPSNVWKRATPKSWLKVCLTSRPRSSQVA